MQAVRQEIPSTDYALICTVTEDNSAYPFPGLGNTFPRDAKLVPNYRFQNLRPLDLTRECALQVARINYHAQNVADALKSLAQINKHLAQKEFLQAEEALLKHRELYGLSFILLKKDLLLSLERQSLPGLNKRSKALTAEFRGTGYALLTHYIYDVMDPTFDPGRASRVWLQICEACISNSNWYARLVVDDIQTLSASDSAISSALLRFSALSLLDLVLLIWRKSIVHPKNTALHNAIRSLDALVADTLRDHFRHLPMRIPDTYSLFDKLPSDIEIFRMSFFFDEISSVSSWRSHVNKLRYAPIFDTAESDQPSLPLDQASKEIATTPGQLADRVKTLEDWEKSLLQIGSQLADQKFLTATLVADSLRKIANGENSNPLSIVHMLIHTDDIQYYIAPDLLRRLLESELSLNSQPLRFVILEVIYRQTRTPDNELERRLAFMDLFKGASSVQVVDRIIEIAAKDPDTAELLARTCTRTFLERLYLMMTSVKDVLETRLRVCRWLMSIKEADTHNIKEEIDALERELANLDARSDLDSTRVHVDEESLREWFKDIQQANAARYVQTAIAEGPAVEFGSLLNFYSNKDKLDSAEHFVADTQIGSEFLLVAIFEATLNAFTSDRTFGLDAYLSRRIRHGTLSGYVITPVARALKRLSERGEIHDTAHDPHQPSGFDALIEDWRKYLINELDHVRKDIIQIKSQTHPDGLIQANWRTVSNIAHFDAMIARMKTRVCQSGASYDIFPDLYALCWDCVESDLAQLRLYMMREFYPRAISRLNDLYENLPPDRRPVARPYVQIVQDTLRDRVQQVCGWFIRPVFRRDRYNLKMLALSTLSIVRELDDRYAFTEEVNIPDEISLNRGGFDLFGDMLFVLVHNAARHGKPDGRIKVSANQLGDFLKTVILEISSEVSDLEHYKEATSRVKSALDLSEQHEITEAAVGEGFSGLRKLAGLITRVRSPHVRLAFIGSSESLQITFRLNLPAEITFTRAVSR
jgi:hypothetical protein